MKPRWMEDSHVCQLSGYNTLRSVYNVEVLRQICIYNHNVLEKDMYYFFKKKAMH